MPRATTLFLWIALFCQGQTTFAAPYGRTVQKTDIGVVLNPEGKFFLIQKPIYQGIKLYFDQYSNYNIVLLQSADDLPGQSNAADQTVTRSIKYVIGHNFSGLAEAYLRKIPVDYKLLYVSPFATNTSLTSIRKDVFLVWPDNNRQVAAAVSYVRSLGLSGATASVVVNESEPYSTEMADLFSKALGKSGAKVVKHPYIKDKFSPASIASQIIAEKPTVLFLPIYNRDLIDLYRALWNASPKKSDLPIILCGDTTGSEKDFYSMLGDNSMVSNVKFFSTNGFSRDLLDGPLSKFAKAFRAKFGEEPAAGALAGYHAAQVMAELISRERSTKVKIYGPIKIAGWRATFDDANHLLRPVIVNEVTADGFIMRDAIGE